MSGRFVHIQSWLERCCAAAVQGHVGGGLGEDVVGAEEVAKAIWPLEDLPPVAGVHIGVCLLSIQPPQGSLDVGVEPAAAQSAQDCHEVVLVAIVLDWVGLRDLGEFVCCAGKGVHLQVLGQVAVIVDKVVHDQADDDASL